MESTGYSPIPEGETYQLTNARTAAKHIRLGWGKLAPVSKKNANSKVYKAIKEAIEAEEVILKAESKGKKVVKPSTGDIEAFNKRLADLEKREKELAARENPLG